MKKGLLFFTLFIAFIQISIGQVKVDPRIQEYLGEEIVRKIVTEHPEQLNYYNDLLTNSFTLIAIERVPENASIETFIGLPMKNGDKLSFEELERQLNDDSFNIFQVDLRRDKVSNRYIKIGDSSKIFVLKAAK